MKLREVEWPTCPVRAVIESGELRVVRMLESNAEVCPLSGWPQRYAAWVPRFWRAYRAEKVLAAEAAKGS